MKLLSTVFFAVSFVLSFGCNQKENSTKEAQLNNEIDSVSYSMGVNIAQNIKSQGMEEINVNALAGAFLDVFGEKTLKMDETTCNMVINTCILWTTSSTMRILCPFLFS